MFVFLEMSEIFRPGLHNLQGRRRKAKKQLLVGTELSKRCLSYSPDIPVTKSIQKKS